jgi:hypothetical protein
MWTELKVAGLVAGAITVVLLARRWTQLALGTGTLNAEFFSGNLAIGSLVSAVENRMTGGGPNVERPPQQPTRPNRDDTPGGTENDNGSE